MLERRVQRKKPYMEPPAYGAAGCFLARPDENGLRCNPRTAGKTRQKARSFIVFSPMLLGCSMMESLMYVLRQTTYPEGRGRIQELQLNTRNKT
jgi:hypothetical protein